MFGDDDATISLTLIKGQVSVDVHDNWVGRKEIKICLKTFQIWNEEDSECIKSDFAVPLMVPLLLNDNVAYIS